MPAKKPNVKLSPKPTKRKASEIPKSDKSDTPTRVRARRPKRGKPVDGVLDTAWHEAFLFELRRFPNVTEACRVAGVNRDTAYEHRRRDAEFHKAWAEAEEMAIDAADQELYRRAVLGTEACVGNDDGTPIMETKYSDRLLEFYLKGRRGSIYGDKSKVEHSGSVVLTDQQIAERGDAAEQALLMTMQASVKGKK